MAKLPRPPVNEDGTVTLDQFTDLGLTTATDPDQWSRSGRSVLAEKRTGIGQGPEWNPPPVATADGGYVDEFEGPSSNASVAQSTGSSRVSALCV